MFLGRLEWGTDSIDQNQPGIMWTDIMQVSLQSFANHSCDSQTPANSRPGHSELQEPILSNIVAGGGGGDWLLDS